MFPLNCNDQYIDSNGKRSTLGDAIGSGGGEPYVLPTATAQRLGGVKIGDGVNVSEDGTISVSGGGGGSINFRAGRTSQFNIPANNGWSQTITFSEPMPSDQYIVTFGLERYATTGAGTYQGNVFYITNKTANGFTVSGYWKEEVTFVNLDWMAVAY